MKNTLLSLIFSITCLCSWAQDISFFTCDSEKACIKVADSLLCDSKREYKLFTTENFSANGYKHYRIIYKEAKGANDTINKPLVLLVTFKIVMVGANAALEIDGVPSYKLKYVEGRYLDIFPIWKKYIDPNADIEVVSKSRSERKKLDTFIAYDLKAPNQYAGLNWTLSCIY